MNEKIICHIWFKRLKCGKVNRIEIFRAPRKRNVGREKNREEFQKTFSFLPFFPIFPQECRTHNAKIDTDASTTREIAK